MAKERLIKRYTNRKLYDTLQSRYVTLEDIAKLVREGEEVRVVDNDAGEDLTAITFAQIILDEEKRKTHLISTPFLRTLIRSGEATVQDLSDRAARSIEAIGDITEKASGRVREVVEEGGRAIDEGRAFVDDLFGLPQQRLDALRDSVAKSVRDFGKSPAIQREVERLEKSIRSIEEMVAKLREDNEESESGDIIDATVVAEVQPEQPEAQPKDSVPSVDVGDTVEPEDAEGEAGAPKVSRQA